MSEPAERDAFHELYRRLSALPENVRAELVAGEVVVLPRPRPRHVRVASRLGSRLEPPFSFDSEGPGGWVILDDPEIRFSEELRIPDLAGWRVERYLEPEEPPYLVSPDWVCEVLSPSTAQSLSRNTFWTDSSLFIQGRHAPPLPRKARFSGVPSPRGLAFGEQIWTHLLSDRAEKMPLYARHGVSNVWLVDPDACTLEVYRRQGELWLLLATHGGDAKVCAEPFDAIELDLAALWRTPS